MKNISRLIIAITLEVFLSSCASQIDLRSIDESLEADLAAPIRAIASESDSSVTITPTVQRVQVCEREFSLISLDSSNPKIVVTTERKNVSHSELEYPWPNGVRLRGQINAASIKVSAPSVITPEHPPLPILPILPIDATTEVKEGFCKSVQNFHRSFSKEHQNLASRKRLSVDWSKKINEAITTQPKPPQMGFNGRRFLIFYSDQYHNEVARIAEAYTRMGYKVRSKKISDIPGIRPDQMIPESCRGAYRIECYHDASEALDNVSGQGVGALKGFYTKGNNRSQLIPYIPGLIRADIRAQKKIQAISGVLLVGNSEEIAPFFYPFRKYGEWQSDVVNTPLSFMNTDLFYLVPDPPLELLTQTHHIKPTTFMWSCLNTKTGLVQMKTFCDEIDVRYWSPTVPITSHRWEPRFPAAPVFRFKGINEYGISGNDLFSNYQEDDIVPVGRIVTHHDRITNDPIVRRYAEKIVRWHHSLPSFKGTSIATYGGSDQDSWTFIDTDVSRFRETFSESSHQYSSQYFVSLPQCQGACSFKGNQEIMAELASSNHVGLYMTGHGAPWAVQAPYPAGYSLTNDKPLSFTSEHYYFLHTETIEVKLGLRSFPDYASVYPLNHAGLIGHVVANSCDLSDINLDKGWDESISQIKSDANQRSLAEQFIQAENGGAMNTFMNSDVGYGYTDDHYNQKFMENVKTANSRCGTIGDALRLTVLDMLKGNTDGTSDWQLLNRQFLGSPINRIAKMPSYCRNLLLNQTYGVNRNDNSGADLNE